MTKDEAVAWAVLELEKVLAQEYYEHPTKAARARDAMSALADKPYMLKRDAYRLWVRPAE